MRILLTGATGYVGGRLLPVLEARGHEVRCLARHPANLASRVGGSTQVVAGDVLSPASLARALEGIETAYYLVHAMGDASGFERRETTGAQHFAAAARAAGVTRIVYLGGLGDDRRDLSPHLRSRHEVGRILRESGVPTLELRASIVIGSGSLSFEMIRALCEHLPVMITPRWVSVLAQPIAIQDLIEYLVQALDVSMDGSSVVEIGGADRLSYAALMREYMRQRHLKRLMIPVPILTPWLSSLWLGLVTPLYARVGRKRLGNLHHLLLGQRQAIEPRRGGNVEAEPLEQRPGVGVDGPAVDQREPPESRFASEEDVGCDVEVVEDVQLLVDERHAEPHRIRDVGDADRLAVEEDGALVRLVDAPEDLHQGGLARAVLPAEGHHLAPADLQIDPIQGHHAGESLGDSPHGQQRRTAHFPVSSFKRAWNAATLSFLTLSVGTISRPPASACLSPRRCCAIRTMACLPNSKGC